MKHLPTISRILLGLIFFVFGLNGFLNFIPQPPTMPDKVVAFMTGLMAAPYFFPLLKGTEVLMGLLLLSNRYVSLAQIVLSPIIVQIFLFHTVMAPSGFALGLVLVLLQSYLAYSRRETFKGVLAI